MTRVKCQKSEDFLAHHVASLNANDVSDQRLMRSPGRRKFLSRPRVRSTANISNEFIAQNALNDSGGVV
jgi:hypothetical protein